MFNRDKAFILFSSTGLFLPFVLPTLWFCPFFSLYYYYNEAKNRRFRNLLFSYTLFASSTTYWLISTIHEIGNLGWILSLIVFSILILSLFGLKWIECILFKATSASGLSTPVLWACIWTMGAFLKECLSFPLLVIGSLQIVGPFSKLLFVYGVYGVTFFMVLLSALAAEKRWKSIAALVCILFSFAYLPSPPIASEKKINISVLQGPPIYQDHNNAAYYPDETENQFNSDLIIWPEATLDYHYHGLSRETILKYQTKMKEQDSGLIAGTILRDHDALYNAVVGLGRASGFSLKKHPVPFSESLPFQSVPLLGWLISKTFTWVTDIHPAFSSAQTLQHQLVYFDDYPLATYICFDSFFGFDAYNRNTSLNIVLSNNSWFDSPVAHHLMFTKARIISLLTRKPTVVASISGFSGLIGPHGTIENRSIDAGIHVLNFETSLYKASAFWSYEWSDRMVIGFCILMLFVAFFLKKGRSYGKELSTPKG